MIIGICGPAGSGKSLVAEHLKLKHGFTIVSLADPLKRIVGELFDFTPEQLYGPSSMRSTPSPTYRRPDGSPLTARHALQTLGTDWARMCSHDVWARAAMREAGKHQLCVIPDVRFKGELAAVREAGGRIIRRAGSVPPDAHESERDLLDLPDSAFDVTLPFYVHRSELYDALDGIVAGWR